MTEEEIHQASGGRGNLAERAPRCNIARTVSQSGQDRRQGRSRYAARIHTITVTDGIAMGHEGLRSSLASREAIWPDTVETDHARALFTMRVCRRTCGLRQYPLPGAYDGDAFASETCRLVLVWRVDSLPAKCRKVRDVPAEFASRDLTVQDVFEAVATTQNGGSRKPPSDIDAVPADGRLRGGQFTANTYWPASLEAIALRC